MSKIFRYDFKIILLKPYVFAMMAITLIYAYFILSSQVILGVSCTAPFSGWSFGKYLGDTTLVSILVTLFVLSTMYSKKQKQVSILADVTGFSAQKRMIIKNIIIGSFFIILNLLVFAEGVIFLWSIFGKVYIGTYILDWILITVPCLVLVLGIGNLLGKINPAFIYIFMGVVIVMSFALREYGVDINGANYFEVVSTALETLKGGETPFTITPGYLCARMTYLIIGIVMLCVVSLKKGEKSRKESY